MVQFLLVRPGNTDYDLQGRIQGTLEMPLNENGRRQAAAAAEQLRAYLPSAIYSAAGNPAEETAVAIGQALDVKVKSLERLTNVNLGLWQGMLVDEVRHKQPKVYKQWQENPEQVHPPEGEMISTAIERVDECLEKLAKKYRTGAIALVASEPLASLIHHRIEGAELGDLWKAQNACRIDILRLEPEFANGSANGAKVHGKEDPRSLYIYRGSVVERH